MEQGIVFDIQRFSLHDGPGIRTSVFLKGCPLRCLWCHNPESQSFKTELSFKSEKCVHCRVCESVCPSGVHSFHENSHRIDFSKCASCGLCVQNCCFDALKLYGKVMSVTEIINEASKDIKYYENSGGGITITGGEPLSQPEFTFEILKESKEKGIHTCIETSGYTPKNIVEKILPHVDLFLFDYKATGSEKHLELTGVSNGLILENLDYICRKGAKIILRCPLIPGINDSADHLEAIANLSARYACLIGIEILPYHDMGRGKWRELGRDYKLSYLKNASEDQKANWISILHSLGCKKATFA
jgi:pyruvate formate lyase activating enzyme